MTTAITLRGFPAASFDSIDAALKSLVPDVVERGVGSKIPAKPSLLYLASLQPRHG